MRVIVCGDRKWKETLPIRELLERLKEEYGTSLLVITGAAQGADSIASKLCLDLGIDQVICPANWAGRSFSAGPIRNALMLRLALAFGGDVEVHAFHRFISNSKGTKNMVERAKNMGVKAFVHDKVPTHA